MEDFTKDSSDIIDECKNIILKYLSEKIGRKKIISVILTGSVARGSQTFKYLNGNLYLENDLDIVVVVNRKSVIKSLILIKYLARKLTTELRKKYLLSSVSLSVMTENSLHNSGPSIFYQDLTLNGKVIFGKDICSTLTCYDVKKIPSHDIYKLVLNRMVETLQVFASSMSIEKKITKDTFDFILSSMMKLTFALIQAVLIKNDILIFRGYNLQDFKIENIDKKYLEILNELLTSYKELIKLKESQEQFLPSRVEYYWLRVIRQFNFTIGKLSGIENVSPLHIKKLILEHEKLSRRIKTSLIIFLQYCIISSPTELLRTIFYIVRFGEDYPSVPLYALFLSSTFLCNNVNVDTGINHMITNNIQNLNNASSIKSWIKRFNVYFKSWKIVTGG